MTQVFQTLEELPAAVRGALPPQAQEMFRNVYNALASAGVAADTCYYAAWDSLWYGGYYKQADGSYVATSMQVYKHAPPRMLATNAPPFEPLQGRAQKAIGKRRENGDWEIAVPICKVDSEKMQVFGWMSIIADEKGNILVDLDNDVIELEELEEAVYSYVTDSRVGGAMHEEYAGELIESMVYTPEKIKALGIPDGTLPIGWWVGYQIRDPEVWGKIKDGTYSAFSLGGSATRVPMDTPEE